VSLLLLFFFFCTTELSWVSREVELLTDSLAVDNTCILLASLTAIGLGLYEPLFVVVGSCSCYLVIWFFSFFLIVVGCCWFAVCCELLTLALLFLFFLPNQ
jgi:hypothetical protein